MNGDGETLNWLEEFRSFTAIHALSVIVFGGAIFAACAAGRVWRGSPRERRLRRGWGWFVAAFAVVSNAWYLLPANLDWSESLPIHVCDLAVFIAAWAMLTKNRPARTILYFWGIGLSTQAFATPTLGYGVGHIRFWWFWLGHTAIVGSAVYDVIVGGYRPRIRDFWMATGLSVGYVGAMLGLDALTGFNYGYVGPSAPQAPTIIDRLGPWPLRVAYLSVIVFVEFLLLWAIWPIANRVLGRDPVAALCPACGAPISAGACPSCGAPPRAAH